MATPSGRRAPLLNDPAAAAAGVPVSLPGSAFPQGDDDDAGDLNGTDVDPLAGFAVRSEEDLVREALRQQGPVLSDDPTADIGHAVLPGDLKTVLKAAEAAARQNEPFSEHAQVAMRDTIVQVQQAARPLIAHASTPDRRRSLNDAAEVSSVARELDAQPKFVVQLPNGAENKQYDHPFQINGYIIYVMTGVPCLVPESVYYLAVTAGLCHAQRAQDFALAPLVSDLVRAARVRLDRYSDAGIIGAGLER